MNFTYHMPTNVIFGAGTIQDIEEVVDSVGGGKILIVTGKHSMRKTGILDNVLGFLDGREIEVFEQVESDPSTETVDEGVKLALGCDIILGLGGGSPLDAAKAISAVTASGGAALDYMMRRKTASDGMPIVAIPTTAGTASEVTEVSVLTDKKSGVKKSFRSPYMYPKVSIDDPELTRTMPKDVTAASGLDALSHAVESIASIKYQPVPEIICRQAAKLVLENLLNAYDDGDDMSARTNMMLASLMAGYGITHSGAGLAHGLSYSIYMVSATTHGIACGTLLPHVMRYNKGYDRGRMLELAKHCGFKTEDELIDAVDELRDVLGLPPTLSGLGVHEKDVEVMVEYGLGGSTATNPRSVDEKSLSKFVLDII